MTGAGGGIAVCNQWERSGPNAGTDTPMDRVNFAKRRARSRRGPVRALPLAVVGTVPETRAVDVGSGSRGGR